MNASLLRQQPAAAGARAAATREPCGPATCSRPFVATKLAARRSAPVARHQRLRPLRAAEEKVEAAPAVAPSSVDVEWVPVMAPEDLPKGVRKEVRVEGRSLLLFWYRNQIYCTEARSPAEGAYSEGLIKGKFTQDFAIECPTTGTLFSLKDGSIVEWYPTNPVLRALTPQCRPLELYPVKLSQDAVSVSIEGGTLGGRGAQGTRGGSDTSIDNNNVFGLEPKQYVAGDTGSDEGQVVEKDTTATVVTAVVGLVAVVGGVAGFIAAGLYWFSGQ